MRLYIIICLSCVMRVMAMQPIDEHWYQRARNAIQPKTPSRTTYWLLIPEYNDRALIQTDTSYNALSNAKHSDKPMYNPDNGSCNFTYVDPTYEHNSGYHILPAGLLYWQSDDINNPQANAQADASIQQKLAKNAHIVRNFPHGKPFAESTKTPHPYISLAQGQLWQSHASPHPTDMTYTVQPPEKMLTEEKDAITVVTSNTLARYAYQKHAHSVKTMPQPVRAHHFKVAQENPYVFWGADCICVQEWDQQLALGFSGYGYIGEQVTSGMTSGIFFNNNVWSKQEERHVSIKNNKQIVATLHRNNGTAITVASCHIPGGIPQQQSLKHIQSVYNEAQQQSYKYNSYIIIAGDFNYNTYTQQYRNYTPRQQTKSYASLTQALSPLHDAATQCQSTHIPTAYNQGYIRVDYIWHEPDLSCTEYHTFPRDNNLQYLIGHTQKTPLFGYHFSDHAVIRAVVMPASDTHKNTLMRLANHITHLYNKVSNTRA